MFLFKDGEMKGNNLIFYALLLSFTIFSRGFISIAGANPLFAVAMFVGVTLGRSKGIIFTVLCILLSDISLGLLKGYPMFGSWTFFTYSGLVLWALIGHHLRKANPAWLMVISPLLTSLFWAWTNLDTWFFTNLYTHDLGGFGQCYFMALPFLKTAMVGNLVWLTILFSPRIFLDVARQPSLL